LRGNCLVKHVIEGKTEGGIEVTKIEGRRRKLLLDGLKETNVTINGKRTHYIALWRTRFGRDYGTVVRQTTK
jgi:hypothetical protein